MLTKEAVNDFLGQKALAVVGVSRNPSKFGNAIYKDLKARGFRVFGVNPQMTEVLGDPCYPSLSALPETVGGVVVVVPPAQAEKVIAEAAKAGIRRVWLQQGSESPAAVQAAEKAGLKVISGECILMYASPAFPHNFHAWIWRAVGKAAR
ncbi:MAG TPA: CoA-binding protein [Anaerolineaceae bacterium]|nr:CoA-binding protein [Anaerolineaceae bacterium]